MVKFIIAIIRIVACVVVFHFVEGDNTEKLIACVAMITAILTGFFDGLIEATK